MEIVIQFFKSLAEFSNSNWWAMIEAGITVGTLVFVAINYKNNKREQDIVTLFFELIESKESQPSGLSMLRKNCTRSEVQGLLGMIYKGKDRYEIKSFQEAKDILKLVENIQTGKEKTLLIKVTEKELEQFNLPSKKESQTKK